MKICYSLMFKVELRFIDMHFLTNIDLKPFCTIIMW